MSDDDGYCSCPECRAARRPTVSPPYWRTPMSDARTEALLHARGAVRRLVEEWNWDDDHPVVDALSALIAAAALEDTDE